MVLFDELCWVFGVMRTDPSEVDAASVTKDEGEGVGTSPG